MIRLVAGVGVHQKGKYKSSLNGKKTKEYILWRNMIQRVYNPKSHKKQPAYKGCTVSDNFKNFQYFAEWCQSQIGFGSKGWQLDKDILIKGNKTYSEDNCVFIPRQLNTLLISCNACRGKYPVGVYYHSVGKKFATALNKYGKSFPLGLYDTPEEAYAVYKLAKEQHVKEVLCLYEKIIDPRVVAALSLWTLEIDS